MKYDLDDVKSLLKESEACEYDLMHEQVSDLLNWLEQTEAYYCHLKSMILFFMSKDYGLSTSTMIGPFVKSVARIMGDEVVGNIAMEETNQPLIRPEAPPNRETREGCIPKDE